MRSPVLEGGPAGAEEAIVFVHGNPGVAAHWTALLEPAGAFARAIALDMPGYGGADKPRELPYTVDGYAAHLTGALDQLGVRRVHLVLHDFGGPWGLQWAADHPEAHASTTLINTGVLAARGLARAGQGLAHAGPRRAVLHELTTRGGMRQFMKPTNPPSFPRVRRRAVRHLRRQGDAPRGPRAVPQHAARAARRGDRAAAARAPAADARRLGRQGPVLEAPRWPSASARSSATRASRSCPRAATGRWPTTRPPSPRPSCRSCGSRPRQRRLPRMLCQVRTYQGPRGRDGRVRRPLARPHRPGARRPRLHGARRLARPRRHHLHLGRRPRRARRLGAGREGLLRLARAGRPCRATPPTSWPGRRPW